MVTIIYKVKLILLFILLLSNSSNYIYSQSEASVEIKIISSSDLKMILEDGKGSIMLLNVWATWCIPCREEFPDLAKLAKKYSDQVQFITISADEISDLDSKVIPFLKEQNMAAKNYLLKVADPEEFINTLNKDWSGAIPATFIYDKKGIQKEILIGKQSYEEFENAIKTVIK